jgi:glutamate-1-semialdehyde 2,1-aminomutase
MSSLLVDQHVQHHANEAKFDASRAQIEKASQWLAGGVSSNFRLGMAPTPLVFESARGAYLFDIDGNRLTDYYLGMGPMILGHLPSVVRDAVVNQLQYGLLYGGQSRVEAHAAELFCHLVPCADLVRFCGSGSEAVQLALRLARAATGRQTVVKFEGHYHGWFDSVLVSTSVGIDQAGAWDRPNAVMGSKGQDPSAVTHTEVLTWNDLSLVEARLARGDVAALIMEPAMCNSGVVMPAPGYLEGVRASCLRHGTVLIFDEVITGFRVAPGGAQSLFGVTPDLAIFGKCLASGFPVAAVGGRAELMELSVKGGVVHGGTYNAQPIAMAATLATLKALSDGSVMREIEPRGLRLMQGLRAALSDAGITASVSGFPQIFHVAFGLENPARNYRDLMVINRSLYVTFVLELLKRRVRVLERGAWFLSSEHDEDVIDDTMEAVRAAALATAARI